MMYLTPIYQHINIEMCVYLCFIEIKQKKTIWIFIEFHGSVWILMVF